MAGPTPLTLERQHVTAVEGIIPTLHILWRPVCLTSDHQYLSPIHQTQPDKQLIKQ